MIIEKKFRERYGTSDKSYGVVWVYSVERLLDIDSCIGNTQMVLEHELGHIFGAEHLPVEKGSFMSDSICTSDWPEILKKVILENKFRDFNPPR